MQSVFPLVVAATITAAVASHFARAATPEEDFAARRTASGVIYSNGFDNASELADGATGEAADGTTQFALNSAQKTSGANSIRFRLRAGINEANIAGTWEKALPQRFGAGTTIYYQVRQRFDTAYETAANTRWNSSYKTVQLFGESSTCQGSELTFFTGVGDTKPSWSLNCGNQSFETNVNTNAWLPSGVGGGDGLIQQGSQHTHPENTPGVGYNCHYQNQFAGNGNGEGCFYFAANTWYTLYVKMKLQTPNGTTGNTLDVWIARDNGPYRQVARVANWHWPATHDNYFNKMRLETYMTELPKNGQAASVDAFIWYDELIVSTQPIAPPGAGGLPAPANLRLIE